MRGRNGSVIVVRSSFGYVAVEATEDCPAVLFYARHAVAKVRQYDSIAILITITIVTSVVIDSTFTDLFPSIILASVEKDSAPPLGPSDLNLNHKATKAWKRSLQPLGRSEHSSREAALTLPV